MPLLSARHTGVNGCRHTEHRLRTCVDLGSIPSTSTMTRTDDLRQWAMDSGKTLWIVQDQSHINALLSMAYEWAIDLDRKDSEMIDNLNPPHYRAGVADR